MKEEDNLQCSNNKVKKSHESKNVNNQSVAFRIPSMPVGPIRKQISYRDSLIGHILRVCQQAFSTKDYVDQSEASDNEDVDEPLDAYEVRISLSHEAKVKICQKWHTSLTVKVFGDIVS